MNGEDSVPVLTEKQLHEAAKLLMAEDGQALTFNNYTEEEENKILQPWIEEVQRFMTVMRCIAKVIDN